MFCRLLVIPLCLGLHLYSHSNLLKESKSCCLLGIDASCRKTCFLSTSSEELTKSCKPEEEVFINIEYCTIVYVVVSNLLKFVNNKIIYKYSLFCC